jgi:hypothetical protein
MNKYGKTVAHAMAKRGYLPGKFNRWGVAAKKFYSLSALINGSSRTKKVGP